MKKGNYKYKLVLWNWTTIKKLYWCFPQTCGVSYVPEEKRENSKLLRMENSFTWKEEVSTRLELDPPVTVSKFRSRLSGLTLVLADLDGPIIEACFCVSKFDMIRKPLVVCSNLDPAKKRIWCFTCCQFQELTQPMMLDIHMLLSISYFLEAKIIHKK
jgi:hypothetical protein